MVDTLNHRCPWSRCTLCHSRHPFAIFRPPQQRDRYRTHFAFHVTLWNAHFLCNYTKRVWKMEFKCFFFSPIRIIFFFFNDFWFYVRHQVVRISNVFYRLFVSLAFRTLGVPYKQPWLVTFSNYNQSVCHWTWDPSLCRSKKSLSANEIALRLQWPPVMSAIVDRHSQPMTLAWSLLVREITEN